jgi:hypothetical protein
MTYWILCGLGLEDIFTSRGRSPLKTRRARISLSSATSTLCRADKQHAKAQGWPLTRRTARVRYVFVWGLSSGRPIAAYLYGMSLRFDWLWECGTRGAEATSRTPQTASSWALPDRLRSLPLRLPPLPPLLICCRVLDVGVEVEETFFLAGPPKTKNLQETRSASNYCHATRVSRIAKRYGTKSSMRRFHANSTSSFAEVARL